jgi:hypothetical protein
MSFIDNQLNRSLGFRAYPDPLGPSFRILLKASDPLTPTASFWVALVSPRFLLDCKRKDFLVIEWHHGKTLAIWAMRTAFDLLVRKLRIRNHVHLASIWKKRPRSLPNARYDIASPDPDFFQPVN